jgi:hypothetical protein
VSGEAARAEATTSTARSRRRFMNRRGFAKRLAQREQMLRQRFGRRGSDLPERLSPRLVR